MNANPQQQTSASVTQAVTYTISHDWQIGSFRQFVAKVKSAPTVESAIFSHDKDPTTKWNMEVSPDDDDLVEGMSLFVYLNKKSTVPEITAKYTLAVVAEDRSQLEILSDEQVFQRNRGWGQTNFMNQQLSVSKEPKQQPNKQIDYLFKDGSLLLRCTIEYTKHETSPAVSSATSPSAAAAAAAAAAPPAKRMRMSPSTQDGDEVFSTWCDLRISCRGFQTAAHRKILSESSPVLAGLIQGVEADGQLVVEGVDVEAFQQALRFIYTGSCDCEKVVAKVLLLATKYQLVSLLSFCEEHLVSTLTEDNAFVFYSWADLYGLARLKARATSIITQQDDAAAVHKLLAIEPCPMKVVKS